jgi:membrane protein implicated in regulation of membrane protease activity
MTQPSGLDIRIPLGGLFTIVGALLVGFGLATRGDAALYLRSLGVNVNLWWGLVMLAFGVVLLLVARRGSRAAGVHPTAKSPEGRATEERERRTGMEGKA